MPQLTLVAESTSEALNKSTQRAINNFLPTTLGEGSWSMASTPITGQTTFAVTFKNAQPLLLSGFYEIRADLALQLNAGSLILPIDVIIYYSAATQTQTIISNKTNLWEYDAASLMANAIIDYRPHPTQRTIQGPDSIYPAVTLVLQSSAYTITQQFPGIMRFLG